MERMVIQDEGRRLGEMFRARKINRAKFAKDYLFPGGDKMIYQHIKGIRPINLTHARIYAVGLGVPIGEISSRLASEVKEAVKSIGESELKAAVVEDEISPWPFSITYRQYMEIDEISKTNIDGLMQVALDQVRKRPK